MTDGNQRRASHLLGIARAKLRKKIDDRVTEGHPVL